MAITLDQLRKVGQKLVWTRNDGTTLDVFFLASLEHMGITDRIAISYDDNGVTNVRDVPLNRLDVARVTHKVPYRLAWLRGSDDTPMLLLVTSDFMMMEQHSRFIEWETPLIEASVTYRPRD